MFNAVLSGIVTLFFVALGSFLGATVFYLVLAMPFELGRVNGALLQTGLEATFEELARLLAVIIVFRRINNLRAAVVAGLFVGVAEALPLFWTAGNQNFLLYSAIFRINGAVFHLLAFLLMYMMFPREKAHLFLTVLLCIFLHFLVNLQSRLLDLEMVSLFVASSIPFVATGILAIFFVVIRLSLLANKHKGNRYE